MTAGVSPVTSAVTAVSSRSWILNTISTFSIASQGRWPDRSRWNRGGKLVCGRRVSTGSWEALIERHGKQSGTRQMIELLKLSRSTVTPSCKRRSNPHWQEVVTMRPLFGTC